MNAKKIFAVVGIMAVLAAALIAGGWFVNNAYAQETTQTATSGPGACHDNQAVLDLLKLSASDLQVQRQAGKSLLDIAAAQGVSEDKLIGTLLNPIAQMHAQMGQSFPQSDTAQMTQAMRDLIVKDIRATQYGTMTDMRLFGGHGGMMGSGMMGGMMGNGSNGMMNGGMMNGGMMNGGMMNGNGSGGMMGTW